MIDSTRRKLCVLPRVAISGRRYPGVAFTSVVPDWASEAAMGHACCFTYRTRASRPARPGARQCHRPPGAGRMGLEVVA